MQMDLIFILKSSLWCKNPNMYRQIGQAPENLKYFRRQAFQIKGTQSVSHASNKSLSIVLHVDDSFRQSNSKN